MPPKSNLLVDTDVVVDFLRGREGAVTFLTETADRVRLSVVVIAELFSGVKESEYEQLNEFVHTFPTIDVTAETARSAGLLKNRFGALHGVGLADALIAATAIGNGLNLATLNIKHYPMFPGLAPAYDTRQ